MSDSELSLHNPQTTTSKLRFTREDWQRFLAMHDRIEPECGGVAFFLHNIFDDPNNRGYDLFAAARGIMAADSLELDDRVVADFVPRPDVVVVPVHKQNSHVLTPENRDALFAVYRETEQKIASGLVLYQADGITNAGIHVVKPNTEGGLEIQVEAVCQPLSWDNLSKDQRQRMLALQRETAAYFSEPMMYSKANWSMDAFVQHAKESLNAQEPLPQLVAASRGLDDADVTCSFASGLLADITKKPQEYKKEFNSVLTHGYVGNSNGGVNGIVSVRSTSDENLHERLDNYLESYAGRKTLAAHGINADTAEKVKIVVHKKNGMRVIGLLDKRTRNALFVDQVGYRK